MITDAIEIGANRPRQVLKRLRVRQLGELARIAPTGHLLENRSSILEPIAIGIEYQAAKERGESRADERIAKVKAKIG